MVNNKNIIRLSKSSIGLEEIKAVESVLKKEFLGMGEEVKFFEDELTDFIRCQTVCVNTGTSALQLALQAIGIKPLDEVLVQSLTYVASFQAITACGAIPIACEVNPESMTIDLNDASNKISDKTVAIMPVHFSGSPGDLDSIYEFANKFNLRVIEDAAHAFGSKYKGNLIGSFGDIICFSFDGIKNITSGEGGAICSRDEKIINKIKDIRLLGVAKDSENRYLNKRTWDFDVFEQGWRYHMSNIMAAIGRQQLLKFPIFKNKRQMLAKLYFNYLKNQPNLRLLNINYEEIVPHIFVIFILNGNRNLIKQKLENKGIQTGIHYYPNDLLSYFRQNNCPITKIHFEQILTLPLHVDLTKENIKYVSNNLISILNE